MEQLLTDTVKVTESNEGSMIPTNTTDTVTSSDIHASDPTSGQQTNMEQLLLQLQQKVNDLEEGIINGNNKRKTHEKRGFRDSRAIIREEVPQVSTFIQTMKTKLDVLQQRGILTYDQRRVLNSIENDLEELEDEEADRRISEMEEEMEAERSEWKTRENNLETYCEVLIRQLKDARSGYHIPTIEEANGEKQEHRPEQSPNILKVVMNPMVWDNFKYQIKHGQRGTDLSVIEVLIEEPSITFDDYNSPWFQRYSQISNHGVEETGQKVSLWLNTVNSPHQGRQSVPERIRIRSPNIISILNSIFKSKAKDSSTTDSIVMIRPFRALVYYNLEIREKFAQLKAKCEKYDSSPDEIKTSEDPDGTNGDPDGTNGDPDGTNAGSGSNKSNDEDEFTRSLTAYQHLRCLIDFMDKTIQAKIDYLSTTQPRSITFNHLWYLFRPGDDIVGQSRRQAYRIISINSTGHKITPRWQSWNTNKDETVPSIVLFCVYIDFDGKQLGPVSKSFTIETFDGEKAITALEVYPIRFAENSTSSHQSPEEIRKGDDKNSFQQELINRWRTFIDVASVKHMHYNGFTLEVRDEVDSQVMIDFSEAFAASLALSSEQTSWQPQIESLIGKELGGTTSDGKSCSGACCVGENIYNDKYIDKMKNENYIASLVPGPDEPNNEPSVAIYPRSLKEIKASKNSLTNDDLMIMSYRVFGFVLRSRKWAKLDLKYLTPVSAGSKDQTSFDQLVLPKQHKEIVHCLVDQHFRNKEARIGDNEEVDIIRGKGLILLLHGSPGVGKTTTAEGIAERFNKPLFQITCGDLGATASEVEAALERNFSLANRWGCILLLDEADVFLSQRSPKNFVRNGLVAVFLRILEYYAGILFLTTNRIGDFDEAFTSRIHISLYYPPLDEQSTHEIFRLNLHIIKKRFQDKGRLIVIKEENILKYATYYWKKNDKMRWNGRQIRNACQTALALAEFEAQKIVTSDAQTASDNNSNDHIIKVELTHRHIRTVSKAYLEFMSYLKDIYGFTADEWAKTIGLRAKPHTTVKRDDGKDDSDDMSDYDDDDIYGPVKSPQPIMTPSAMASMAPMFNGTHSTVNRAVSNASQMSESLGFTTSGSIAESGPPMMQAHGSHMMPNTQQGVYYIPQQFLQAQNYPPQGQFMMNNQAATFNPAHQQMTAQNWSNVNGKWQMSNTGPSHPLSRSQEGASPDANT